MKIHFQKIYYIRLFEYKEEKALLSIRFFIIELLLHFLQL